MMNALWIQMGKDLPGIVRRISFIKPCRLLSRLQLSAKQEKSTLAKLATTWFERGKDLVAGSSTALFLSRPMSALLNRERASRDRKSTRLNSSHTVISYAVFCLKKKKKKKKR